MQQRGAAIVEDLQQAGFTSVRPIYASLKRGWAVCVLTHPDPLGKSSAAGYP